MQVQCYRYNNAGQDHLVLGKVSKTTQLCDAEVTKVHQLCPAATLEDALIYHNVWLSGVVYTYLSHWHRFTNDYTLLLKDSTNGKAVKYLSICSFSCTTFDTHRVLVHLY